MWRPLPLQLVCRVGQVSVIAVGLSAARSNASLSSGSVPVSHLAHVEALVQRAAAEAATRCGSGAAAAQLDQNGDRQLSVMPPRGAPPSYAASTAVVSVELLFHDLGLAQSWCASGCVVECRICNREVAGSNLGLGYFTPRSAQPSVLPGPVNEYQLRLGIKGKGRYSSFCLRIKCRVCR